jgi:hypothetical protein
MPDKKKKNKKVIELQDLTPKKDVRGGVSANVNANVSANVSANKSTNVSANRSTNVVSPNLKI